MNNEIKKFVNYWERIPLWDSEKNLSVEIRQKNRNIRLNQNNIGLLMNLRYQGQGVQEFLGKSLKNIKSKTLIMYGEKDLKYKVISKIMSEIIENSELNVVSNSGHNIILENPIYVSQKIKNFILGEKL
jgi:2-succinyl-6-hydroxy-2,4-cyclohexadiene-1-carboxylate synthase